MMMMMMMDGVFGFRLTRYCAYNCSSEWIRMNGRHFEEEKSRIEMCRKKVLGALSLKVVVVKSCLYPKQKIDVRKAEQRQIYEAFNGS